MNDRARRPAAIARRRCVALQRSSAPRSARCTRITSPQADGMIKLDAWRIRTRCRRRCAPKIARRGRRASRSTAIPTAGADGVKARAARARSRCPTALELVLGNGSDELIQMHHARGRAPGRGDARARAVVRHVPAERDATPACATSACRCAPISRSTSTRCWRRSSASARRSSGSPIPNNPTGNLFDADGDRARSSRAAPGLVVDRRGVLTRSPTHAFLPRVARVSQPGRACARCRRSAWPALRLGYAVGAPRVDRASSTRCGRRTTSTR